MKDRILDLSEKPARLSVRNGLLVISFRDDAPSAVIPAQAGIHPVDPRPSTGSGQALRGRDLEGGDADAVALLPDRREEERRSEIAATKTYRCERPPDPNEHTVPLADVAVLIAAHPQISFSHAVLAGIAEAGGMFVVSNEKRMPCAMLLPLETHSTQTERFAAQATASVPLRKRVWQEIVQAQIRARARLLVERTGKDFGLAAMAARVRSGDPQNLEAQAARVYWRALFGDEFRRRGTGVPPVAEHGQDGRATEEDGLNSCLNYGYGVLRAIVARALCAAGLHPALGLHHHNRYDTFCLADDLMEPFRPLVDRVVAQGPLSGPAAPPLDNPGKAATPEGGRCATGLDRDTKKAILQGLLARYTAEGSPRCDRGESRTLFDWVSRAASSLAAVIEGRAERIEIPDLVPSGPSSDS